MPDGEVDVAPQMQLLAYVAVDAHQSEQYLGLVEKTKEGKSGKESSNRTKTSQNTMKLVTGDLMFAHDEKKRHNTAEATPISSQKDGARNQTVDSNMVEDSVGGGKKKKRRKQEAKNSGPTAIIDGATDEPIVAIKNSVPQIKSQKFLNEDDVPDDMSYVHKKSVKGKSKEKGVADMLSDASLADETTQDAPSTPQKVQKSGDNIWDKTRGKDASTEVVQTKGSEDFHASAPEKINFMDYFCHKDADQSADTMSKETKGNKKTRNSFSNDRTSASVDTRILAKNKKPVGKFQTTEKPVKSYKEHILSDTYNDKSRVLTSMDNDVSKKDDNMKRLLADMAVTSDASTEDEEEVRGLLRRPMVAVRKVASKVVGEKMDSSRKTSAFSYGGVHGDMAVDTSTMNESESVNRGDRGSPMPGKEKGTGISLFIFDIIVLNNYSHTVYV
jgi:hypothetical protein